jgi:hypothetical protein
MKPITSVKKPGIIKSNAAKAIAAPDIISKAGVSFLINWENPDLRVFKPSYLAYIIPIIAVMNIKEIVLNAPI